MPNTLLMMNALTNVVMKANTSSPLPKIEMIELMSSDASSDDLLTGDDLGAGREDLLDRGLHRGGVGAVGDA